MIHHLHIRLHLLKNVPQKNYREREGKELPRRIGVTETLVKLWEDNKILSKVSLSDYLNKDKKSAAVKKNRRATGDKGRKCQQKNG